MRLRREWLDSMFADPGRFSGLEIEGLARALTESLLPEAIRSRLAGDCLLGLDGWTSAIPWEMLRTDADRADTSLALAGRLVRAGAPLVRAGARRRYRIFLSSTLEDLRNERRRVEDVLAGDARLSVARGDYVEGRPVVEARFHDLDASDIYVGIFAYRYGYVPEKDNPEGRSITELEYRRALERGIPCLIFLLSEDARRPRDMQDLDLSRIERLRKELRARHALGIFSNAEELAAEVLVAVRAEVERIEKRAQEGRDACVLVLPADADSPVAQGIAGLIGAGGYRVSSGWREPRDIVKNLSAHPYRLLHVESPGGQAWADPKPPALDLGDGLRFSVYEIQRLEQPPELVVLHEISTGPARAAAWGQTLLQAGVKAVVVNAWGVETIAARHFMQLFYSALLERASLAEAGLLARRELRRVHPGTLAWAAFQLYGDPEFRLAPVAKPREEPPADTAETSDPALRLIRQVDAKAVPRPGLYRLRVAGDEAVTEPARARELAGNAAILLLVHAVGSAAATSFRGLWRGANASVWKSLDEAYGGRIAAFEHWALTRSPVENALDLARALPQGARLHLLTLSNGGLIGELLCRGARVGGPPIDESDLTLFDGAERDALRRLGQVLESKRLVIERFVRVACPARGSNFPHRAHQVFGKLSKALSVLGSVVEGLQFQLFEAIADPERVPGLQAMATDSPLIQLLNRPEVTVAADLSIVAGSFRPGSLTGRLAGRYLQDPPRRGQRPRGADPFHVRRHAARAARALRAVRGQGVNHFSYFERPDIVATIRDRLLGADGGVRWETFAQRFQSS